ERGRGIAPHTTLAEGWWRFGRLVEVGEGCHVSGAASADLHNLHNLHNLRRQLLCLSLTAIDSGPSPSAISVMAPANSKPSTSNPAPLRSCTARIATSISTAMHVAQKRV